MGKLFPYAKARAGAGEVAIAHFKEATKADSSSSLVWEMLGEMLAPGDPAGTPHSLPPSCMILAGARLQLRATVWASESHQPQPHCTTSVMKQQVLLHASIPDSLFLCMDEVAARAGAQSVTLLKGLRVHDFTITLD